MSLPSRRLPQGSRPSPTDAGRERTPPMTKKEATFDKDVVRELAALLEETGLTEIEIEHEGKRVRVARGVNLTTTLTTDGGQSEARETAARPLTEARPPRPRPDDIVIHPGTVTSPMVGTAYRSPEPG